MNKLAIQSYCFRHFKDNARVAELLKECGVDAVELCRVHVDFRDEAAVADACKVYGEAGIQIVGIGVERFSDDESGGRRVFDAARRFGTNLISADFDLGAVPAAYRVVEGLADEFGMRAGIHNHGARHWLGSADMLKHVFGQTSDRIGLCLDTAWALDSRLDPVRVAEQFMDRLCSLHLKDFVFDRAGKPEDVVLGEGNLDLAGMFAVLQAGQWRGPLTIEYEGDVEDPVPALKECVAAVRAHQSGG